MINLRLETLDNNVVSFENQKEMIRYLADNNYKLKVKTETGQLFYRESDKSCCVRMFDEDGKTF